MKKTLLLLTLCIIASSGFLTGCATKGPQKVYAMPARVPERIVSPTTQAIADAPRTKPGKVMDPDSITYAQVPSRIIYLPGQHGIFGRTSATQEVAYNLVPVDRIGAIQAESTPEFGETIVREQTSISIKDVIETTFMNDDGSTVKGTARRLGVLGNNDVEKNRAENLLKRGEDLRWSAEMGWVGFFPEKKAKPYKPTKPKKTKIPDLEVSEKKTPKPEIEAIKERNPMDIISKDETESEIANEAEKKNDKEEIEIEEEIDLTIE
jgi:hypothetical protein